MRFKAPSPLRRLAPLAAAALLAACAGGHGGEGAPEGKRRAAPPVPVLTGTVSRAAMPVELAAVGTVEAAESVAVRAQVTGTVLEVGFAEGQAVARGQLLFRLDAAPLEAAYRQAKATLARDSANLAQARADAKRFAELGAQGFVSRQQAEQAGAAASALEASVAADRALVENARVQLDYATIRAPISGVAGARQIDVGNLARAGDTAPLVVINQQAPIFVSFAIPQSEVSRFRAYQRRGALAVSATPRGGKAHAGTLAFVDNAIDPTTGTLTLKARFPNRDGALLPGQFADVALTLAVEPDRIVAPAQAVLTGQSGEFVFVVDDASVAHQRAITRERTVGDRAVIAVGLAPGEEVVVDGTLQLKEGAKVVKRENLIPPSPGMKRRAKP